MGNALLETLWGCGDLDQLFNGSDRAIVPWQSAGRLKGEPRTPSDEVKDLLAGPARLTEVDPRTLRSSQPWVVRTHATYYLSGEYEITGRTSADMHSWANRYPTFAKRRGQLIIVTGHHRSLVALIEGRPVLARVVHEVASPVSITPHLSLVHQVSTAAMEPSDVLGRLRSGQRCSVSSVEAAAEVLRQAGLSEGEVKDRLRRIHRTEAG